MTIEDRSQNTAAVVADLDLLTEVADVLAENNWRGDLVERLRDAAELARSAAPASAVGAAKFDEIRDLLTEAHQFKSTSPVAQSNISAALDLLDEIEAAAQPPAKPEAAPQAEQMTPLDYRAQGREEALAIILAESAEDPFAECIGWSKSGAPEDEGGSYWDEGKLRALLHIGDRKHDAYDRAEAAYWDALGRSDEAKRELLFAQQAPFYQPLHDFLAKHEAWDLMGDLKRPVSLPDVAMPEQNIRAALVKAREDINWMLNSQQFLNDFVFKYIDDALATQPAEGSALVSPVGVAKPFRDQIFRTMVATWAHNFPDWTADDEVAEKRDAHWRAILDYISTHQRIAAPERSDTPTGLNGCLSCGAPGSAHAVEGECPTAASKALDAALWAAPDNTGCIKCPRDPNKRCDYCGYSFLVQPVQPHSGNTDSTPEGNTGREASLYSRLTAVLLEHTKLRGHTIGFVGNQLVQVVEAEFAAREPAPVARELEAERLKRILELREQDLQIASDENYRMKRESNLWRKLISDTNAVPCRYPCLRDNLADWLADNGEE